MTEKKSYQQVVLDLERFWAEKGCVIQQPYDLEVGAGTLNPATLLRVLGPERSEERRVGKGCRSRWSPYH